MSLRSRAAQARETLLGIALTAIEDQGPVRASALVHRALADTHWTNRTSVYRGLDRLVADGVLARTGTGIDTFYDAPGWVDG